MIKLPDRLLTLIERIEAGEAVTQDDVDRVAVLQSLDAARLGRQFVEECAAREAAHTEMFRQLLEQP